MRRIACMWAGAALLLLATAGAAQAASVAKIALFRGEVKVTHPNGDSVPVEMKNFPLEENDRVVTGANGQIRILYADSSWIDLKPGSDLTVRTGEVELQKGDLKSKIAQGSTQLSNFKTPSGVAAVKGTLIEVRFDPQTGDFGVNCDEGAVNVTNTALGFVVDLPGGKEVLVKVDPQNNAVTVQAVKGEVTVETKTAQVTIAPGGAVRSESGPGGGERLSAAAGTIDILPKGAPAGTPPTRLTPDMPPVNINAEGQMEGPAGDPNAPPPPPDGDGTVADGDALPPPPDGDGTVADGDAPPPPPDGTDPMLADGGDLPPPPDGDLPPPDGDLLGMGDLPLLPDGEFPPLDDPMGGDLFNDPFAGAGDALTDATQDAYENQIEGDVNNPPPADPDPDPVYSFTGRYLWTLTDMDNMSDTNDSRSGAAALLGPVSSQGGTVWTTDTMPYMPRHFELYTNPVDTLGPYAGVNVLTDTDYVDLLGATRTAEIKWVSDNLGEFVFFTRSICDPAFNEGGTDYDFSEFAYAGLTSLTRPNDGVYFYGDCAPAGGTEGGYVMAIDRAIFGEPNTSIEDDIAEMGLAINFHNNRVIGHLAGEDGLPHDHFGDLMFFGSIDAGGHITATLIKTPYMITSNAGDWVSWSGAMVGDLYGSQNQGVGFSGTGLGSSQTGTSRLAWDLAGAAFKDNAHSVAAVPGGSFVNRGYVAGVDLDVNAAAPAPPAVAFSVTPANFVLNIDADAGTVGGSITTAGGGSIAINATMAGGTGNSAFIGPDLMVSIVTGGTVGGNDITDKGSYLVAYPDNDAIHLQTRDWIHYGRWSITHVLPNTHPHVMPEQFSHWVAGAITPVAEVQDLIDANIVAIYSGASIGTFINGAGTTVEAMEGTCRFRVDFGAGALIGGSADNYITLGGNTLNINGGSISTTGMVVSAGNFDWGGQALNGNSQINGSFFGSGTNAAESLAGNFYAEKNSNNDKLVGVYIGNK